MFGLPSAYARSILTTPWAEMGDRITMTCQKTNYSAAVMFHTKVYKIFNFKPLSCIFYITVWIDPFFVEKVIDFQASLSQRLQGDI